MSRRIIPAEIKELTGAFDHDPQRRRPPAPKSTYALGAAPAKFTEAEREVWAELARYSAPGVLTGADRHSVEIYCRLLAQFRSRQGMSGPELSTLIRLISLMGGSPVDRMKLQAPVDPKVNDKPYAEFAPTAFNA